jgi:hypothetical protein
VGDLPASTSPHFVQKLTSGFNTFPHFGQFIAAHRFSGVTLIIRVHGRCVKDALCIGAGNI